jgi:hypothetical protein
MTHVVKWTAPTKRADNNNLPAGDISHYIVSVDGGNRVQTGTNTSLDLSLQPFYRSLSPGQHNVTVKAVDKYGSGSAESSAVQITIAPPAAPVAPSNVTVA